MTKKNRWIGAGMVILAVMTCALAWAGAQRSAQQDRDPFVRTVAQVRPSILAIGSYQRQGTPSIQFVGTGFVVHDGQTAVTNAHVVEALRKANLLSGLRVWFPDDQPRDGRVAKVVAEDAFHDLALLRFDGPPGSPLKLSTQTPPQGRSIGIVGYPIGTILGLEPAANKGIVSAIVPAVLPLPKGARLNPQLIAAIQHPYDMYQLDLVVFPGNSGSPLFDADTGQVLAIINKTLASSTREHLLDHPTAIAYAVPSQWINQLIAHMSSSGRDK